MCTKYAMNRIKLMLFDKAYGNGLNRVPLQDRVNLFLETARTGFSVYDTRVCGNNERKIFHTKIRYYFVSENSPQLTIENFFRAVLNTIIIHLLFSISIGLLYYVL